MKTEREGPRRKGAKNPQVGNDTGHGSKFRVNRGCTYFTGVNNVVLDFLGLPAGVDDHIVSYVENLETQLRKGNQAICSQSRDGMPWMHYPSFLKANPRVRLGYRGLKKHMSDLERLGVIVRTVRMKGHHRRTYVRLSDRYRETERQYKAFREKERDEGGN